MWKHNLALVVSSFVLHMVDDLVPLPSLSRNADVPERPFLEVVWR